MIAGSAPGYGARPMTDAPAPALQPVACSPCSGSGKVLSNLGGTLHSLPCPWCEGTGVEIPGHDAQAARRGVHDDAGVVQPETD